MSRENERGAIYITAAERAREIVQHDITASYESCGHDANLLIVLFLRCALTSSTLNEAHRSSDHHRITSIPPLHHTHDIRELVNGLGKPVHVHTAGRLGMSGESGRGMP